MILHCLLQADELVRQVTCTCGEKFCFQCGDRWHNPIRCDWMKGWTVKCSMDSSTTSWIASNTKVGNFSSLHSNQKPMFINFTISLSCQALYEHSRHKTQDRPPHIEVVCSLHMSK